MMNTNNEHTTNGGGAQDASLSRVLSSEEVAVKVNIHYRTVVSGRVLDSSKLMVEAMEVLGSGVARTCEMQAY